jgi:uncharacterized protein
LILSPGYDFDADIHLFKHRDLNLVLDVNSGAVHVLDDLAAYYLQKLMEFKGNEELLWADLDSDYSQDQLQAIKADLEAVYHNEALFTDKDPLPYDLLADLHVKALCLNIAHACNMKCRYCFASQGDFGLKPSLMSLSIGQRSLDFLFEHSGPVQNLEVDFFGGEPLLNADIVRQLVLYGRKKAFESGKMINFTLTTNAILLNDDMIDFIIDHNLSVIMSLDGRPETNDRHRIFNDGEGTYHSILPQMQKLVARHPVSYYVRGTFTRLNPDFSLDLRHLVDLGFDCISLEPAAGAQNDFSIKESDLEMVLAEYDNLTDLLCQYYQSGKPVNFFHFNLDLQKGPCLAKRTSGCGAGVEYLVVTPEGDVYPCHQFVGETDFKMGNIQNAELDLFIRDRFEHNRLTDKEECQRCWARNFCGGGCHANAYHANSNIGIPDMVSCAMHRKRIEGAIYLEAFKLLSA